MKYLLSVCLFVAIACSDESSLQRVPVEVVSVAMPARAVVNEPIQLQIVAIGQNGCYTDIVIALTKTGSLEYLITASAIYDSNGICPEVLVTKDTTINFTPTEKGDYTFVINKAPFLQDRQTLTVD